MGNTAVFPAMDGPQDKFKLGLVSCDNPVLGINEAAEVSCAWEQVFELCSGGNLFKQLHQLKHTYTGTEKIRIVMFRPNNFG